MLPPFRQIKFEAKLIMMRSLPFWIKATLLLIGLQFAMDILVGQAGGALASPILYPIDGSTNNLLTGFTRQSDRLLLLVRLEIPGIIVGATASLEALRLFFLYGGLFFLLMAPFKMGLLELLWRAFRGEELRFSDIFRWYTKPARIGKSVLVQFVVSAGSQILALIAMVPGYALYYVAYSGRFITAEEGLLLSALSLVAITVLFIGLLAGFFFYAILAPLAYCLAAQPEYSLTLVFQKGFGSIKGYVKRFFYFRLSMFHWHIISILTLGIAELYIFPYITFASLQFLQEAAIGRKEGAAQGERGGWQDSPPRRPDQLQ